MPLRRSVVLSVVLAASWIIAAVGVDSVQAAASLNRWAGSNHPYLVLDHFTLLYLWLPLVTLSSFLLVLSPGLMLLPALGGDSDPDRWLLKSLGLGVLLTTVAAWTADMGFGLDVRGTGFVAVTAATALLCLGASIVCARRGHRIRVPSQEVGIGSRIAALAVPTFLLIGVLTPKIYWESFNGDGAHAFEVSRLVVASGLPFFSAEAGLVSSFPGVTSLLFAYPNSWFIRLFGELEAAVRLPFFLYLAVLHSAICAAAGVCGKKVLGVGARWLLWLGLAVYAVVVSFSASYNPYHADIALPATQDTLFVVCFLGFVVFFARREHGWMVLFLFLTLLSLPSWPLLVGAWLVAVLWLWRPVPWRTVLIASSCVVLGFALSASLPGFFALAGLPTPGNEYAAGGLIAELRYIQLGDVRRFLFVLVPAGILPGLGLLAWKRQDRVARALTVVTAVYFAVFYFKAHIALHHFVPAMLLPLVVFWRLEARGSPSTIRGAAIAAAALVALLVSMPADRSPHTRARLIGAAAADTRAGYEELEPSFFRDLGVYHALFPPTWDPRVPGEEYGGSPLTWNYYARRGGASAEGANYLLIPRREPAPAGMRLVATEGAAAIYLRSDSVWRAHATPPPTSSLSAIYSLPNDVLFGTGGPTRSFRVFDTHAFLRKLLGG